MMARTYTEGVGRRFRFVQVDVFTDTPLHGNPLAVFLDADGLSEVEMQGLAREMNLSETVFVLPVTDGRAAERAGSRLRIFTPGMELPFAGHPSIGAAWVLADEGRIPMTGRTTRIGLRDGRGRPRPVDPPANGRPSGGDDAPP